MPQNSWLVHSGDTIEKFWRMHYKHITAQIQPLKRQEHVSSTINELESRVGILLRKRV